MIWYVMHSLQLAGCSNAPPCRRGKASPSDVMVAVAHATSRCHPCHRGYVMEDEHRIPLALAGHVLCCLAVVARAAVRRQGEWRAQLQALDTCNWMRHWELPHMSGGRGGAHTLAIRRRADTNPAATSCKESTFVHVSTFFFPGLLLGGGSQAGLCAGRTEGAAHDLPLKATHTGL